MFKTDLTENPSSGKVPRRAFLGSTIVAVGGSLYFWFTRNRSQRRQHAKSGVAKATGVDIVEFTDSRRTEGRGHEPKVVKSESEWKKQLTPNAFDITRHEDTEMAFSGQALEPARQRSLSLYLL